MKSVNIPAQVTTVEDRIAGNLTLTQLGLLAAPIFIDFAIYALMPKPMHLYGYKLILMTLVLLVLMVLAIRLKGKIILLWALTLLRFRLKDRLHVFNKNSLLYRTPDEFKNTEIKSSPEITSSSNQSISRTSDTELKDAIKMLGQEICFIEEKRGRLYVYTHENH